MPVPDQAEGPVREAGRSGARRRWKQRVYEILEVGHPNDLASRVFDGFIVVLIVTNVVAVALETVEPLSQQFATAFRLLEAISVAIFTIEYAARLWVCTEHPPLGSLGPVRARLRFAFSFYGLIDLLAFAPFYLAFVVPGIDLRVLRLFRLLWLLKLARHSPALATLGRVVLAERRALVAALLIMAVLLMLASSAMYYAERAVQPDKFASIPHAMWWAIATMTTVGYGDVTPITAAGRIVGGITMIFGLAMFALPVGIVASGFASEIHRRDFTVRWGMVARVPLFARLDALGVTRITNLLKARSVVPGAVIMRRGEVADSMFFITSGEVEVTGPSWTATLGEGDFFGEVALVRETPRTATVRALTQCRLLVLGAQDFRDLLEADPELRDEISRVALDRLAEQDGEAAGHAGSSVAGADRRS